MKKEEREKILRKKKTRIENGRGTGKLEGAGDNHFDMGLMLHGQGREMHQQLILVTPLARIRRLTVSTVPPMAPLARLLPALTHLTVYFLHERGSAAAAHVFPPLAALPQLRLLRIVLHEETLVMAANLQALAGLRQLPSAAC